MKAALAMPNHHGRHRGTVASVAMRGSGREARALAGCTGSFTRYRCKEPETTTGDQQGTA